MTLTAIYAGEVATAVAGTVTAAQLAASWYASHPPQQDGQQQEKPTDAQIAAAAAFLTAAGILAALDAALDGVLTDLWAEGWMLGQGSAGSLITGGAPGWRDWTPGDADAARDAASDGLASFLDAGDGIPGEIAGTYAGHLANLLATASLEGWSDTELADAIRDTLHAEHAASVIAHTETCRAQFAAATHVYRESGITAIDVLTEDDTKVCAACRALAASNPHPIPATGAFDLLPVHPYDRCVPVPAAGQPAARHAQTMTTLLRRVLSDGYVPCAVGRA
jgi:hypothetical protein